MSERNFRFIQGVYLLIALYLKLDMMIYIFIGVFLFEAITNFRVPTMVSRLRYGAKTTNSNMPSSSKFHFEAERMLRLTVVTFLVVSYILYPQQLWFVPWFVATMLLLAGISSICPMVMFYRALGFR